MKWNEFIFKPNECCLMWIKRAHFLQKLILLSSCPFGLIENEFRKGLSYSCARGVVLKINESHEKLPFWNRQIQIDNKFSSQKPN